MKYAKYITHEGLYIDEEYKNEVSEETGYDSRITKIFLNASKDVEYWNVSEELKNVLKYISTQKPTDEFTIEMQNAVVDVCNRKEDEIMDFERYVAEKEFLTAKREKMEAIKEMMDSNLPIELIAKISRLPINKTNDLIAEIEKREKREKEEHS